MKLVMSYIVGDNATWSCKVNQPIEYKGKEKFREDFLNAVMAAVNKHEYSFTFLKAVFYVHNFGHVDENKVFNYIEPFIYTIDEWFRIEKLK